MKDLLLSGVVDAALGEVGVEAPEIKPLIPDAQNAAFDWYPQDRHLSDQPRPGGEEFGAQGDALDRRRTDPRLRDGPRRNI